MIDCADVDLHLRHLDGEPHLRALVQSPESPRGLVVVIHGWLGGPSSPYVERVTAALLEAGFTVACLVLRDHGDTESLNHGMFSSAKIDEVHAAAIELHRRYGRGRTGLVGFSLGGNFALRLASLGFEGLGRCLAVCPVVDPPAAVDRIDRGWFVYQSYFMRRWRASLKEKQAAFPHIYQLDEALSLSTVSALTDYVVDAYLPFADSSEYYAHYTIDAATLDRIDAPTTIVAAVDDPVIPIASIEALSHHRDVRFVITDHGGHCGFLEKVGVGTWLETVVPRHFADLDA